MKDKTETCKICNKIFDKQGYGGHMWGVHGIRVGLKKYAQESADMVHMMRPVLEELKEKLLPTYTEIQQKVSELEKALKFFEGSNWFKTSDGKLYLVKKS